MQRFVEVKDPRGRGGHESSLFAIERYFKQRTAYDVSGRHRTNASLEALSDYRVQYTTVP